MLYWINSSKVVFSNFYETIGLDFCKKSINSFRQYPKFQMKCECFFNNNCNVQMESIELKGSSC